MKRRMFIGTGFALAALALAPAAARAQGGAYPSQSIRMIVPFAAGGGVDAYARLLAQQIRDKRHVEIVVENRAGSNGTVGGLGVSRAEPNGYTILFSASTHVMAKQVMQNPPYDPLTAFTPIARVGEAPMLLVMNPKRPQKNISEIVADAKSDPSKWDFAVAALGSMGHLATIGFGHLGGLNLTIVPYRGTAPGLTDVAGGHVQLMIDPIIALLPMAQNGNVKPLAITTAKRSRLAPDIPTAAEAGMPGLEFSSWYGVWGPLGMPKDVVAWLNAAMNEAVRDLAASGRLDTLGIEPVTETPEAFSAFVAKDVKRNAELLEIAKFKPM
ncbi:MAG: tripartite tricarboxylate transporter substrate binding protein [Beijerinckiaceae bacterium]|nr:tripartite tricarboxylate transporter substrate binding protein [Beijerinckiaceae bacterium]